MSFQFTKCPARSQSTHLYSYYLHGNLQHTPNILRLFMAFCFCLLEGESWQYVHMFPCWVSAATPLIYNSVIYICCLQEANLWLEGGLWFQHLSAPATGTSGAFSNSLQLQKTKSFNKKSSPVLSCLYGFLIFKEIYENQETKINQTLGVQYMKTFGKGQSSSFAASCLCFGRHVVFHRGGVGRPDRHTAVYMNSWDPNPKGCFFLKGNTEIHQINVKTCNIQRILVETNILTHPEIWVVWDRFRFAYLLWMSQRQSTSCRRFDVLQCWPPLTWRWRLCKKWKERYWWYLFWRNTNMEYVYI